MDGSPTTNSYLSGNFAPVRSEDDYDLEVVGDIPSGLRGTFYRNGPNPQFEPRGHYHWFTGDGMIHAFFVEGGRPLIATVTSARRNGSLNMPQERRCSAVSTRGPPTPQ
jgi:carotenoid cleavage dioxygenase-like enzyme